MKSTLPRATVFVGMVVSIGAAFAAEVPQGLPELTQFHEVDRKRTCNLSATGASRVDFREAGEEDAPEPFLPRFTDGATMV